MPISDPDEIRSALGEMPERDRQVVELRYGLRGQSPLSRADIGRLLGISRERVRQLETRTVDRLGEHAGAAQHRKAGGAGPPSAGAKGHSSAHSRQSFLRRWTFALLWLRPAHVYELRGRLRELGLPPATYRLLQSLERDGYLSSSWAPGRGAGPSRRVYSLTLRGVEQLHEELPILENMAGTLNAFLADPRLRSGKPG